MEISRGDLIELEIEKFADKGKSLARVDGFVVFVQEAVPGDRVRAKVYKRKKSYAEAVVDELLEPSDLRTTPRCFYFGTCGGCQWQHVQYDAQAEYKRQSVEEALIHQGGFEDVDVRPTIGADRAYDYRNRMDFSFSRQRWLTREEIDSGKDFDTDFALGLHVPGNPFKVLDLHECHLQSSFSARLVNGVRDFATERGWQTWDIKSHHGYLRHLVLREPDHSDDFMVNLVTSRYEEERMEDLAVYLQKAFPAVSTFINTINTGKADTIYGEDAHVLFGPGTVRDRIGPHLFEVGPEDFFQTNTRQAERLYEVTREFADLRPDDLVYDLYCGAGTISLFISDAVERVVGIELSEETVEKARSNAEQNDVDNCTFVAGTLRKTLTPAFVEEHSRPDVLIVDPPRPGLHEDVTKQIAAMKPERFVYVSCNPQTQARDLGRLTDHFTIEAIQPVDLFPQTQHIENVVALRAK